MDGSHSRQWRRGISIAVLMATASLHPVSAVELLGRYSVLRDSRTKLSDPLSAPVNRHFGTEIVSVGDAVRAVLGDTGFSLAPAERAPAERAAALAMALPAERRELRFQTLREALQHLIGDRFTLIEDLAHHLISFEPCVAAGETLP